MNKKQEISNIANIIENETQQCNVDDCTQCQFIEGYGCLNLRRATALYNAGYRNADEVRKETAKEILNGYFKQSTPAFDIAGNPIIKIDAGFAMWICKEFSVKYEGVGVEE